MTFRELFPIVAVEDVDAAVRFYVETLGAREAYRWPSDGPADFVFLRLEPLGVGLTRRSAATRAEIELCAYADDVDTAVASLEAAGARVLRAPADEAWGERAATIETPEGHVLHLMQKL
jgi:uncharacterized glyoxalase superfamily protein PhnB